MLNDHLFGKELFIWFAVRAFLECLSICVCFSFHFGSMGGMWDLTELISVHFISFHLKKIMNYQNSTERRL